MLDTYCADEVHWTPCHLPCNACKDDCDGSVAYLVTEDLIAQAMHNRALSIFGPEGTASLAWFRREAAEIYEAIKRLYNAT